MSIDRNRIKYANLARWILEDERWYKQYSASDRDRYIESLADEIEDAVRSQINHFRESLHVTAGDRK